MTNSATHEVDDRTGTKPVPAPRRTNWGTLNAGPDYWIEPARDRRTPAAPAGGRRETPSSQTTGT